MIPKKFLKQRKAFGKVKSERILTRKFWDHAINFKEMFKPRKERIYPLSKSEREEVQNFVEDQLKKGYIQLSKSPQMSPVFFVDKKDRSKRMVMDYCNLNEQTIKNSYLLPLITDLIDNIGGNLILLVLSHNILLSTFLTHNGLFSFSNLKSSFSANLLLINNPIAPLFSRAFTNTSSYVSIFSSPILSQISLSGLNVHFISFLMYLSELFSFRLFNTLYLLLETS